MYEWDACHLNVKSSDFSLYLSRAAPSAEFSVDRTRHLMSFLTMMGPSPDWNVGLSSEDLCTRECGWVQKVVQDLIPWDAGTDSGVTYEVSTNGKIKFPYFRFEWIIKHLFSVASYLCSTWFRYKVNEILEWSLWIIKIVTYIHMLKVNCTKWVLFVLITQQNKNMKNYDLIKKKAICQLKWSTWDHTVMTIAWLCHLLVCVSLSEQNICLNWYHSHG